MTSRPLILAAAGVAAATTVAVHQLPPAAAMPAPGMTLTWQPPTNACYIVQASTNLQDWYYKTNALLTATSVFIPQAPDIPAEFYRAYTALQAQDGSFYVQNLGVLTNIAAQ